MALESGFQKSLKDTLKERFPGCIVMKNDPTYIQGIPDLLILFNDKWAALECKREARAHHQPNQDYYISKMNGMSYASFVCPENLEEVLNDLEYTFGLKR